MTRNSFGAVEESAVPGPLRPQPARPRSQDARRHGRRGVVRTIFAQPNPEAVKAWEEVGDQLAASFPKVGPVMDEPKAEVLAFTAFPRPTGARSGRRTRWSG